MFLKAEGGGRERDLGVNDSGRALSGCRLSADELEAEPTEKHGRTRELAWGWGLAKRRTHLSAKNCEIMDKERGKGKAMGDGGVKTYFSCE